MFSSIGHFKKIQCPQTHDCTLANCLFSHEIKRETGTAASATGSIIYDPFSAGIVEQPPLKRRRLDSPDTASKRIKDESTGSLVEPSAASVIDQSKSQHIVEPSRSTPNVGPFTVRKAVSPQKSTEPVKLSSVTRNISPPVKQNGGPAQVNQIEKLMPRQVIKAPVQLNSRLTCLKLIHDSYNGQNERVRQGDDKYKALVLLDQELIKLALDDEQEVANSATSSEIYRNVIAQKVLRAKKISSEDWKKMIMEKYRKPKVTPPVTAKAWVPSGLSDSEEIELLRGLKTAVAGLEAHGYVTSAPSAVEIEKAQKGVRLAAGYETCDRCTRRFQVFPGRNSDGLLTTQGACYHHWGKLQKGPSTKASRATGQNEGSYPCCGKAPGSEGCAKADTHVFKVSDPKRLGSLLQFEKTPMHADAKRRSPVAFDCEMGYTTYGMELIRVTAVSWPDHRELLDVLVRPYGEILDMNTRFSGVTGDQLANAQSYGSSANSNVNDKPAAGTTSLRRVESPAAARQLMFDLLTPDTPLIGHAIENDLNACRMIHPFIIDTVLLYPHPRGLPFRFGLKMLTMKYLGRSIQTAGEQGHDSREDSIATGDLVRAKVAEKWKNMQSQGWKFQDGRLVLAKK